MFDTQRDLVVYIHTALMQPHDDTSMACALHRALIAYAVNNELREWIDEVVYHA